MDKLKIKNKVPRRHMQIEDLTKGSPNFSSKRSHGKLQQQQWWQMSEAKEKSSLTAAFFLRLLGKATEESDFRQRKAPVLPYKPE
ncbi:hypothetical protein VIGAN_08200900 [Vigna angularis var. angularis]|uniref:Uncharacterized protein n=1 Tax=Vigna angularis var. angularis TaxID=157739 RepID=A0A0S3SR48_PHAAN|nr:hypothetical protein VIGAN_08200900 [Vigna angularis var. angularis]